MPPADSSPESKTVKSPSTSAARPRAKKTNGARVKSAVKRTRISGSSRAESTDGKLVCRYCSSDDLAPSFKKRRDARCRACFKKRYGSKKIGARAAGNNRKTKAAK
jgi:hypothetical protein